MMLLDKGIRNISLVMKFSDKNFYLIMHFIKFGSVWKFPCFQVFSILIYLYRLILVLSLFHNLVYLILPNYQI